MKCVSAAEDATHSGACRLLDMQGRVAVLSTRDWGDVIQPIRQSECVLLTDAMQNAINAICILPFEIILIARVVVVVVGDS